MGAGSAGVPGGLPQPSYCAAPAKGKWPACRPHSPGLVTAPSAFACRRQARAFPGQRWVFPSPPDRPVLLAVRLSPGAESYAQLPGPPLGSGFRCVCAGPVTSGLGPPIQPRGSRGDCPLGATARARGCGVWGTRRRIPHAWSSCAPLHHRRSSKTRGKAVLEVHSSTRGSHSSGSGLPSGVLPPKHRPLRTSALPGLLLLPPTARVGWRAPREETGSPRAREEFKGIPGGALISNRLQVWAPAQHTFLG